MATVETRHMTADEFILLPNPADGSRMELQRGEVVRTPRPGFEHGLVQGRAFFLLETYARASRRGRVTVESGQLTERGPDTVRGPDVAFWSFERVPADQTPRGYPDAAADLVVEVMSPSDTDTQLRDKVREYLTAGVRVVWVVDPADRRVTVYHRPDEGRVLWPEATLTEEEVLPGF